MANNLIDQTNFLVNDSLSSGVDLQGTRLWYFPILQEILFFQFLAKIILDFPVQKVRH